MALDHARTPTMPCRARAPGPGPVIGAAVVNWQCRGSVCRLASIPDAVIELSPSAVASAAGGRDLGRCLAVHYKTTREPQPAQCAEPPEPYKDPQVISVSL